MSRYKSSRYNPKNGDLTPTVIIEFHNMSDLWMTKEQYDSEGKFKGFLKSFGVPIYEINKVHHLLKYIKDYPTKEWAG